MSETVTSDHAGQSRSPETIISKLDTDTPSSHSAAPFSIHPYGGNGAIHNCKSPDEKWEFADIYVGSGDKIIATFPAVSSKNPGYPRVTNIAEMRANANLFIAAPDLLEALIRILDNPSINRDDCDHWTAKDLMAVQKAVAKAVGKISYHPAAENASMAVQESYDAAWQNASSKI